jgi:hypothetical protein
LDILKPSARGLRTIACLVRTLCAAGLILLIVLPFAPPFSTCDLSTLLPSAAHTSGLPDRPLSPTTIENHAAIHAARDTRHAGRELVGPSDFARPPAPARTRSTGWLTTQARPLAAPAALRPLRI